MATPQERLDAHQEALARGVEESAALLEALTQEQYSNRAVRSILAEQVRIATRGAKEGWRQHLDAELAHGWKPPAGEPEPEPPPPVDPEPPEPPLRAYGAREPIGGWAREFDCQDWTALKLKSGAIYEGMRIHNSEWIGASNSTGREVVRGARFSDSLFEDHATWANRLYEIQSLEYKGCTLRGVLKEHAIYANLLGGDISTPALVVDACLFEDIGSQAIQLVAWGRRHETAYPELWEIPGGEIIVHGTMVRMTGRNPGWGRASFPLSFFRAMHPVLIEDTILDNRGQSKTRGGYLCEGYKEGYDRPFTLTGGETHLVAPGQPVAKIQDCPEVVIQNHVFDIRNGGQNWIQLDRCADVLIDNCDGDTQIMLDGKILKGVDVSKGFQS